ncbi:right-handed parallel beta-helix repeat-containing protein [Thermodesulfobacteriota bacterium]
MELHRNIRLALISILIIVSHLTACSRPQTLVVGKQTLEKDTIWEGEVLVTGDIYVPPGITLTVKPGTMVKFTRIDENSDNNLFIPDSPYYPEAELIIRGRLIAKGTSDKWVVFTSAERDARAKDWGAINFLGSDDNIIEYAKILCAYNGVHAHGSSVTISHSEFIKNGVGISFKKEEETPDAPWFGRESDLIITDSLFTGNKGGIGFRNAKARIMRNEIVENKFFGIWPKEKSEALIKHNEISDNKKGIYLYQADGVVIEYNNIHDNDYNIAVAEAQDLPVAIPNNWFGLNQTKQIDELIFDQKDDPELAQINYQPFLEKKVTWEKQ